MIDVSYISYHLSNFIYNILGKLRMVLDIDRLITIPNLENLIRKSLVCKDIFIDTLVSQVTCDSLKMYKLR